MKYYFLLQFKRLKRDIKSFGIDPYAGIGLFLLSFILISISLFNKLQEAAYLYSSLAIVLIYFLGSETRNQFLQSIFLKNKFLIVRLVENVICAIPFSTFL